MIRLLSIIALLFCVSSGAQTWNQADSLTNLLTRPPVVGGWYSVKGYRVAGDWGSERTAQYVRGDTTTTNQGNVFSWSGGRLKFLDSTNTIQRLSWWGGGPLSSDNTKSLTNAANYVSAMGGGYVKADGGTHAFLYGGIVLPSGVRLIGDGPNSTVFNFTSSTPSYDYEPVISWVGTVASTVKLHSVPSVGDRTIVLSSSVSWANGDWIQLSDTNAFSFGSRNYYHQGEFNFVYSNTGGTNIALVEPLEAAYPTATTTLNKITPTVGSAEGIHFALGTKSGAVRLAYADGRSYLKNCSAAGTENTHFSIDNCYGVQASGLTVDWDSDPSVGLNYGLVYGDSEYLQIGPGNFLRSARHGIASGGSSIPTRYCRVFNSTFGSTRQNIAGADMHGDVVESTFENCTFLSGLTLGGGRNRVLNSTIMNGRGATGVSVGECYYYDWEVRGNRFLISSFDDEAQSVWAMRFYLDAGSQSGQPASTNYWPGTWGGTSGQTIKILDNEIQFTGIRTNGNYVLFVDEAASLTANTNLTAAQFGGLIVRGNRIIPSPDQAFAQLTTPGISVQTRDKVRFAVVDISDNPFIYGSGTQIRTHYGRVSFNRNTVIDQNTREGVQIVPITGTLVGSVDVEAIDNVFIRPIGAAVTTSGTAGSVLYRGNRVFNHGSINDSLYRFALVASDGSASIASVELTRNLVTSTNTPSYDVYVSTVAGTLRDEWTETGGSVSAGTRSACGGYTRAPFTAGTYGSTNAIAMLGQYTTLPTASSYPPGLAHSAGDLWYSDGAAWTNFMRSGKTTFPSMYVTNDLSASNIVATTTTLRNDGSRGVIAIPGTYPVYVYSDTNAFTRLLVNNINSGSSVASILQAQVPGAQGYFGAYSTNNSSGDARARAFMSAITGAGLAFDLLYPNSMDMVYTYGGGTEFARLSTNTFSLPGLTTLAPTNVPTHVAIFDAAPTSTRRLLKSTTVSDLKNSLAIGSTDITDSTSAGRTLLTSASASDQRTSLGLGTAATHNVPAAGNAASGEVVKGSDTRLTDSRTPTSHTHPSTDISDSTSAGRALLTAANASAQRSSLGLGTIATIDDAPSDGNQYVRSNATWAIASGGGGGISGIRVTDGTTDADGITNILFNPAGGSGFAITVTDMGTRADVDFEWLSPGFGINGTFPTYGTERWNINSTTPSAPSQTTVTRPVSSSTNVVMIVDVAPTLAGISRQTWSNSTAYVLVASGTLNTTNMPYDGAMLQGVVGGTIKNNSGANTTIRPVFMVGSTTNYLSNGHLNLADSATTRAWRFDFEFYRASSTLIGGGFNHTVSGASAPTIGTGSLSSTPTVTQRNALFADVACDISTNTTWAFYLSVDVANTTNIVSVTYGGMK